MKSEYRGPHGRLVLYFGNKDTAPLTAVSVDVPAVPGLRMAKGAVPTTIPPRAQVQMSLDVAAVQMPAQRPTLLLSYTAVLSNAQPCTVSS